jgi:cbb3-type cytochrome oxidase subunit 3
MLLFVVHTIQAAEAPIYQTSLYTGTVFLFLLLVGIIGILLRKYSKDKHALQEKEEKIIWLNQRNAETEQRHMQKEQELEKEILKQIHTIETLELRLKEGTKNQVVSKIEELQNRRKTAQGRPVAEA